MSVSSAFAAEAVDFAGVIDLHAYSANSFTVVRAAKEAGMRAVVLKNHYVSTTPPAQLAMGGIGGIEVFDGLALAGPLSPARQAGDSASLSSAA